MKKFMVFGFTNPDTVDLSQEPTKEEREDIMKKWRVWMEEMGELLIDMGSPLINGKAVNQTGELNRDVSHLAGYMKFSAENFEHALQLLNKSPLFNKGHGQNYELFECVM